MAEIEAKFGGEVRASLVKGDRGAFEPLNHVRWIGCRKVLPGMVETRRAQGDARREDRAVQEGDAGFHFAVHPPSTIKLVPVVIAAAGERR